MFGADAARSEPLAFFIGVGENPLGFRRQMQLGRLRNALAQNDARFDFAAHGVNRNARTKREKPGRHRFILAHQTQQNVFGRDGMRPVLKRLVAREKNNPTSLFRVTFKHKIIAADLF